jgi:hypothetical protein
VLPDENTIGMYINGDIPRTGLQVPYIPRDYLKTVNNSSKL